MGGGVRSAPNPADADVLAFQIFCRLDGIGWGGFSFVPLEDPLARQGPEIFLYAATAPPRRFLEDH